MRSRNRLHRDKVEEFAAWMVSLGYKREPLKGVYEVLRLRSEHNTCLIFYRRDSDANGMGGGSTHITANGAGDTLVSAWLRNRNRAKHT